MTFRKDLWDCYLRHWPMADRRLSCNGPINNCGTHLGSSPLLFSKAANGLHRTLPHLKAFFFFAGRPFRLHLWCNRLSVCGVISKLADHSQTSNSSTQTLWVSLAPLGHRSSTLRRQLRPYDRLCVWISVGLYLSSVRIIWRV